MTAALQSPASINPSAKKPTSLLDIDDTVFQASFAKRSFAIRHHLSDHPLFALPRLIELSQQLPKHRVEYNAGNVDINQDPDKTPLNGLAIEETIRRIEECKSWLVLKNVELVPEYSALLEDCLREVFARNHPATKAPGLREAFIFVSSAGAVTPYHIDPELNFLLQIKGRKFMHVFSGDDRDLVTEEQLETFYHGAHRNLPFKDAYQQKAVTYDMLPGDGVHVPVTHPHWVKVGDESYSISFSITFQTAETEKRAALYQMNHSLRKAGGKPTPPGMSAWNDSVRYGWFRTRRKLRTMLGMKDDEGSKGY